MRGNNRNNVRTNRPVLNESIWRRAERGMARRERDRLIANGTITPAKEGVGG